MPYPIFFGRKKSGLAGSTKDEKAFVKVPVEVADELKALGLGIIMTPPASSNVASSSSAGIDIDADPSEASDDDAVSSVIAHSDLPGVKCPSMPINIPQKTNQSFVASRTVFEEFMRDSLAKERTIIRPGLIQNAGKNLDNWTSVYQEKEVDGKASATNYPERAPKGAGCEQETTQFKVLADKIDEKEKKKHESAAALKKAFETLGLADYSSVSTSTLHSALVDCVDFEPEKIMDFANAHSVIVKSQEPDAETSFLNGSVASPECEWTSCRPRMKDELSISYLVVVRSGKHEIHVPLKAYDVGGFEKQVINGNLKKVWRWMHNNKLTNQVGMWEAYELAKESSMKEKPEVSHESSPYLSDWGAPAKSPPRWSKG